MRAPTVLCLSLLTACGNSFSFRTVDGYRFDYEGVTAERTESGPVAADLDLAAVDHRFGSVDVVGIAPGTEPGWSWNLETWARTAEEAEEWASLVELEVTEEPGAMRWKLVMPTDPGRSLRGVRSTLAIRVPHEAAVQLANRHGPSRASSLAGNVEAKTAHGSASFELLTGALRADHQHGDLTARSIGPAGIDLAHGQAHVESVAGELTLEAEHGPARVLDVAGDLTIDHRHGDVEVARVGFAHVRGAHGDWKLEGLRAGVDLSCEHGDVSIHTEAGDVRVRNRHGDLSVRADSLEGSQEPVRASNDHGDLELHLPASAHGEVSVTHGDLDVFFSEAPTAAILAEAAYGDVHSDVPVFAINNDADTALRLDASHGDVTVRSETLH